MSFGGEKCDFSSFAPQEKYLDRDAMDARFKKSLTQPRIAGFEWQEPEDQSDATTFRHILTHGCSIINIIDHEDYPSGYVYTVGFYLNLNHPEFLLMGVSTNAAARMLNHLFSYVESGNTIKDGEGVRYDFGIGERRLVAQAVPQERYFDYLGWGCWFYRSLLFKVSPVAEHKFPVLQLCWPDKEGKYPWEGECDASVRVAQTLIPIKHPGPD